MECNSIDKIDKITGTVLMHIAQNSPIESFKTDDEHDWRYNGHHEELYVGCDVGKSGAICIIDNKRSIVWRYPLPTIGKKYDLQALSRYVANHAHSIKHCVIEDVHAPQLGGRTSCFEFGFGKGILEMVFQANEIPYTLVSPKKWQKEMWSGVTPQIKKGKKDTKATSEIAAKRLFPNVDLRDPNRKTERVVKAHDGVVDGLLMAEYCRRKFR